MSQRSLKLLRRVTQFMKFWPTKMKRSTIGLQAMIVQFLLLMLVVNTAYGLSSSGAINRSKANVSTALYEEAIVDMEVKYLGGYLVMERQWANGRWTFNPNWSDLQFYRTSNALGTRTMRGSASSGSSSSSGRVRVAVNKGFSGSMGSAVPGDLTGSSSASDIKAIRRNGFKYEPADDTGSVYAYSSGKNIVKTDTGYRWKNRKGSWIDFNTDGHAYQFGNRNDQITQIIRNDVGDVESVVDHFGQTLVSFTYDDDGRPATLRDYSGRQVIYHWDGSDLRTVTDVRGKDWIYTYEHITYAIFDDVGWKVIASKTDPENRVTLINHSNFTGGSECVAGTGLTSGSGFSSGSSSSSSSSSSGGLSSSFGSCSAYMVGTPRVTYANSTDDIGVIESYSYFYNAEDKTYDTTITKAGMGEQSYVANLLGETVGHYINDTLQYTEVISTDRRRRVHTDINGYVTTKVYDEFENLTSIQYPDGTSESWTYGNFSNISTHTNTRGVITTMAYDDNGNLELLTEAKGTNVERITRYTYDSVGRMETMLEEADDNTLEALTQWTSYDDYGNALTRIDPENVETHYTHDALGNVLTYRDGRENTWLWTYDAAGNMLTSVDPRGQFTEYTYDNVGNLKTVTDALKTLLLRYTYNTRDKVTSITNYYDQMREFVYNDQNQLVVIRDENKNETIATFDSFGRSETVTDPAGNVVRFDYTKTDSGSGLIHHPTSIHYPSHTETYTYDRRYRVIAKNRILANEADQLSQYRYDGQGNLTRIIDPALRESTRTYDELDRLVTSTDADEGVIRNTYDNRNNLLTVTNELEVTIRALTFNRRNELIQELMPSEDYYTYEYNDNGYLATMTDGKGQRLVQIFDEANRQRFAEYYANATDTEAQKTVSFDYNDANLLTGYDDGTYSATYTYDDMQRPASETTHYGAFSLSHSSTYTPTGKKATFTHPDNRIDNYYYDGADRLNRITIPGGGSVTVNQFDWMAPNQITFPGGSVQENTYDDLHRLTGIVTNDPGGNTLMSHDYDINIRGNVASKVTEHGTYTYGYDDLDRLSSAINPNLDNEAYTFDATGNVLTSSATSGTWDYSSDNELEQAGENSFVYDANGSATQRTVNGVTQSFVYDLENRLSDVYDANNTLIAQYHYDPFGRRVAKYENGQTTYYHFGDQGLLAEYDGTGELLQAYSYQPGNTWGTDPLYTKVNGNIYYYVNDRLGTPQKLINNSGATVWSAEYNAFGEADVASASSVSNPLRFPGQYYDDTTGLHYNYFRDYDPLTGRYLQSDPIGLAGGINTYMYAYGNANRYTDPTGEFVPFLLWGAAQYARCLVGCITGAVGEATKDLVVDYLTGQCDSTSNPIIDAVADAAPSCASACLNPLNLLFRKKPTKQCFVEGTPVHTDDGLKPIEEIKVGDLVASRDEQTGETTWKPVVELFRNHDKKILNITFQDQEGNKDQLGVSLEHPFWVVDEGWVTAENLHIGDLVQSLDKQPIVIVSIENDAERHTTYNFEVEDYHTYFVGDDGVWVHNKCVTKRSADGRLRNADGTFAYDGGPKTRSSNFSHGNTRTPDTEATLYGKFDANGNFEKWGISQDASTRYTAKELAGGRIKEYRRGPRDQILDRERRLVERFPGPKNNEPWAGAKRPQ